MSGDLLARLIADGTDPALVAEVAMLLAEKKLAQEAISERRAKDRERQNRRRSRDVTECHVTERDNADTPSLSRPLSPQTPHTPTHTHPEKQTRARKGHRLPSDWVPAGLPATVAELVAEWPPGQIDREEARFRDWAASATGPNAVKTDWDAAWRNWIRKRHDEGFRKNGTSIRTGGGSGDGRSTLAKVIDAGIANLERAQAGVPQDFSALGSPF